ncbi:MAG: zinc-binding dehydrogenase [Thermoprotei archaeon]
MRAWRIESFGGGDKLHLAEVEQPRAGRGEAVVRVAYAGVNPVDRSIVSGRFQWIHLPHTPGAEFVGTVEELGGDTPGVKVGDRVAVMPNLFCGECHYCVRGEESSCLANPNIEREPYLLAIHGDGGWAEYVRVPTRNLVSLPQNLDFKEASTLPVDGLTAWHMLRRVWPRPGELVVVVGSTGGVGSFALQFAKIYGCSVVAVVGGEAQARAALELGADYVVDRSEDLARFVRSVNGGRGADIVVDPVGSATWNASFLALAPMGRYVTCGVLTGTAAQLDLLRLYSMQVEVIGSTVGSRADMRRVLELASKNRFKPLIDSSYTFEELGKAYARLNEHGRRGKVVLRIGG